MKRYHLMYLILCIAILAVSPNQGFSQVTNTAEISENEMRSMLEADRIPVHRAVNTEGSPFLNDDFHEGVVYLKNGHVTRPMQIRYNSYQQTIEILHNNQAFSVGSEDISSFYYSIDGNKYEFRKGYDASRLSEEDLVQVLAEGEVTFLARHYTNFFEDAASYGTATQQDRYRSGTTYYLQIGEESPNRIRSLSERRVMRNFDRFEDELEAFADQHNLDFSDPDHVTQLVEYYNSLVAGN
jgi:hypothetical protein